jgi:hypothetical protein
MLRAKLPVVAALIVMAVQFRCVAACASELCNTHFGSESAQPCNRHHDRSHNEAPGSCAHNFIESPSTPPETPQIDTPAFWTLGAAAAAMQASIAADTRISTLDFSSSPPGFQKLSSAVLRI